MLLQLPSFWRDSRQLEWYRHVAGPLNCHYSHRSGLGLLSCCCVRELPHWHCWGRPSVCSPWIGWRLRPNLRAWCECGDWLHLTWERRCWARRSRYERWWRGPCGCIRNPCYRWCWWHRLCGYTRSLELWLYPRRACDPCIFRACCSCRCCYCCFVWEPW